jgi:hypothetical protein
MNNMSPLSLPLSEKAPAIVNLHWSPLPASEQDLSTSGNILYVSQHLLDLDQQGSGSPN